jgi:hypothetical protein
MQKISHRFELATVDFSFYKDDKLQFFGNNKQSNKMTKNPSDSNLESFINNLDQTKKEELLKESKGEISFAGNVAEIHEEKQDLGISAKNKSGSKLLRLVFLAAVLAISGFILLFFFEDIEGSKAIINRYLNQQISTIRTILFP